MPRQPVSIEGAAVLGNRAARVAIIEYSDFQCPYCRVFARDILPQIKDAYVNPGKALLAFRHLPLVGIHPPAMKAAEGVECAGRQGKFWEMHERLFATGRRLDVTDLVASSDALGLDSADFFSCLDGRMMAKIQADIVNARDLHISTTPTFLIGRFLPDGRVTVTDTITGARPLADFRAVLDKLTQQVAASAW